MTHPPEETPAALDEEITAWARGADTTLGSLLHVFGRRAFALALVILMAPSALPIPTGGITHVLDVIAMLVAVQLMVGRQDPWLPARWRAHRLDVNGRFLRGLLRVIRAVERLARPRLSGVLAHRTGYMWFGAVALLGAVGAFLAPPFTGLDTLPALGVVVLALGVVFGDALIALVGSALVAVGIALEITLGRAAFDAATTLWPW